MIADAQAKVVALQAEQRRTHEALGRLHGQLAEVIKNNGV